MTIFNLYFGKIYRKRPGSPWWFILCSQKYLPTTTNVLVLPKLFKRQWCKYLQPVCKSRAPIGISNSCAALDLKNASGKAKSWFWVCITVRGPKTQPVAIKPTEGIFEAFTSLSRGAKLKYCEFYLVKFHSLLIFWWMNLQEDSRETWAHRGMKNKGCLWCFFPFNLLQIPLLDCKCQNGFIKAKVCGRALTAKALLSLCSLWRFSSKLFPPCVSSVTKPIGNQLHMLPQVFLQLHSFVCMWW